MNIEVVSEFELLAAKREGFTPRQILVNGPAKHHWLRKHPLPELSVNFDSTDEANELLALARRLNWRVGVRCLTDEEFDPESPALPTQFGLAPNEAVSLLKKLKQSDVRLETIHFHLRTNVPSPEVYGRALQQVAALCRAAKFEPRYVDVGGGLPPPHTLSRDGRRFDSRFSIEKLGKVLGYMRSQFPTMREFWLENGRFVSARSGALIVKILDVKERRGLRQLICDGGRTMNALVSNWEQHRIIPLANRRGPSRLTAVCGPTCMAFDQLACCLLPASLRASDHLLWLDAGAYHIPWETRFSHGLANVLWHDEEGVRLIRKRETFGSWWGEWRNRIPKRRGRPAGRLR
jgi:diaminopimelate decarboxylase